MSRTGLVVLLATAAGCARLPIARVIESHAWPTTAPLTALERVVNEGDGYVLGTVEQAEADWTYDDICGLFAGLLGQCGGTNAYRLTIRADQPIRVWVFVPRGDTLAVPVGTQAVFIWKMTWVRQLWVCAQRMRRGVGYYCESDWLPVMESRDAVAAPADSGLVALLFAEKRRP